MDNQLPTAALPVETNPLLARARLPGETFTLPSGGLFYDNTVLDSSAIDAEVHVHPMTTLDEITMKSPDMLFSGNAVKAVFKRCIPQVLNPGALLSKDVDFLLACLRKVSYGEDLQIEYKHDCENAADHSYMVDVSRFVKTAKRIDPTLVEQEYSVAFDNGQVAKFQPVTFANYIEIMKALSSSSEDDDPEIIRDAMVRSLSSIITQVDEITDNSNIAEWLKIIPPRFVTQINEKVDAVSTWGANFTAEIKCLDCGKNIIADVPLNPLSFFM